MRTRTGLFLGTPGFASPEQVEGRRVDARSDVFSLGCVFYRMLTSEDPFEGDSAAARIASLLRDEPSEVAKNPKVAPALRQILTTALAKDPEQRFADARELGLALAEAAPGRVTASATGSPATSRQSPIRFLVAAGVLAALFGALWWARQSNVVSKTFADMLPRVAAMQSERDHVGAWNLSRQAVQALPEDEQVRTVFESSSAAVQLEFSPEDAVFSVRAISPPDSPWHEVGQVAPGDTRLPPTTVLWRLEAPGYETAQGVHSPWEGPLTVSLRTPDQTPPGMIWVPDGSFETAKELVPIAGFWMDRLETTNEAFEEFVAGGAYRSSELAQFEDATGQPGPAYWRLSKPPDGAERLPVVGISWFEAHAYCESQGKELPTFAHWNRAASAIDTTLQANHFSDTGTAPVGSHDAISRYGASDMAGNVREWIVNPYGSDRYVLGGGFNQPEYMFEAREPLAPASRPNDVGVRCMKLEEEVADELRAPLPALRHDFRNDTPIDDAMYAALVGQYSYDPSPVEAELVARDENDPRWIRETVTYDAAYGDEQITTYLFLPRDRSPPYQTVVYFPGSAALTIPNSSSDTTIEASYWDFIQASGRVLVYPVYKGMYERGGGTIVRGAASRRERLVQWSQDVSRTVDYLETRSDFDPDSIAFLGLSLGGYYGPIFAALEPRFCVNVFIAGGLATGMQNFAPEIHPLNHAPRITAPTLMIAGRSDFLRDIELEQRPLYDAIGLEEPEKRFAVLDGAHVPNLDDVIREVLDWLDQHMGRADS
ncbi:MAG: SUMF1/EgtB/PvdO family nonheme iron enzyme [Acidobacteriota bacterium]